MKASSPSGFEVLPDGRKRLTFTVPGASDGASLPEAVLAFLPRYSLRAVEDAAEAGAFFVNGRKAESADMVRSGDIISYEAAPEVEPDVDRRIRVVYETERYAVVGKSGNMPCHPAGKYFRNTLYRLLLDEAGFSEVHFVNRLDRETSGLVLVAKNAESASILGRMMAAGRFSKLYMAAAEGEWTCGEVRAEGRIRLVRGTLVRKKREFSTDADAVGLECVTLFRPLSVRSGYSLLEVKPVTGRPHQIRATLKFLGFPVVGDKLYGFDETIYARMCGDAITERDRALLRIGRQALHSWKMSFRDPDTGREKTFEEPPPDDMSERALDVAFA